MTSIQFQEMQAARAWGILPSDWDNLTADDKARCMALLRAEKMMDLVDQVAQLQDK